MGARLTESVYLFTAGNTGGDRDKKVKLILGKRNVNIFARNYIFLKCSTDSSLREKSLGTFDKDSMQKSKSQRKSV